LKETLITCASSINLDGMRFSNAYVSVEIEKRLQQHLSARRQLQVTGFPALFLVNHRNQAYPLALGFSQTADLEQRFYRLKEQFETTSGPE
jgi:putative protein-disulfide isomerase